MRRPGTVANPEEESKMDEKRLAGIPLFESLSKRDRRRVAELADEVDVPAGKALIHEGRFAYEFFLIEEGKAEVSREGRQIAELGPGDFFGEMAALDHGTRTADVVAKTAMTAIVLTAADFRHVTQEMPSVAKIVADAVTERTKALQG
jgi:CRP/FNR family transcriptional regulator, cyclic AMP receptor protein